MTRFRDFLIVSSILVAIGLLGGIAFAQTFTSPVSTTANAMPEQPLSVALVSTQQTTSTQSIEITPTRAQLSPGPGSVPSPCEITLLEPIVFQEGEGDPQIRFNWALNRSLTAGEYYLLFVGGLVDDVPYMMGSFWDPVLENKGPWSLEVLETMGPLLKLFELKEPVYEMPFLDTDDAILRWEVQVRDTGSEFREASPFDPFMCKRDSAVLSITSTDGISPTLSLEVVPTPTLMPIPTLTAEELLLAVTPETTE